VAQLVLALVAVSSAIPRLASAEYEPFFDPDVAAPRDSPPGGVRQAPGDVRQTPPGVGQPPAAEGVSSGAAEPARDGAGAVPLPHSRSLLHAVDAGTRTLTGEPGPRYWQQRVDYRIDAEVDFSVPELRGRETITYHNHSPDAIDTLGLKLMQNVMKEGAARTYAMPTTGGMTVRRLAVGGREISMADTMQVRPQGGAFVGASGTPQAGTLVWVALPEPIPAGGTREIEVEWSFRIPPDWAPRMGMQDSTTVQMAQWYPEIAVYDDLDGWDRQLYLGTGEFYYEYGDFDVTIRVPPGFVVGATGTLQNADEVLTRAGRERLKTAERSREPVRILSAAEFGTGTVLAAALRSGPSDAPGGGGETPAKAVAWRFRAKDVRDFAFATSDHYQWDATYAVVDSAAGRKAMVNAYWRPDRPHADQAARMAAHAIAFHSAHVAPYIYPQISVSDGGSGGMEYPMIVFVQAYEPTAETPDPGPGEYSLIAHEIGHEWFPMMVGSNETAYGWQDEGVNTFRTLFASQDYSGAKAPDLERARSGYLEVAGDDHEQPIMTHADGFPVPGPWYRVAAYFKPTMVLLTLRDVLGPERFDRTLTEYVRRWTLKHPAPQDFFDTFEQAAGQDLDWFWRPWFYETAVLDLAVAGVEPRQEGGWTVTVANQGRAPAPVVAEVRREDGGVERLEGSVLDLARTGSVGLELGPGSPPASIQLDPEGRYPDADRSNDQWKAGS
jgi:hypothetical protein